MYWNRMNPIADAAGNCTPAYQIQTRCIVLHKMENIDPLPQHNRPSICNMALFRASSNFKFADVQMCGLLKLTQIQHLHYH
jgi:hypothetical protein